MWIRAWLSMVKPRSSLLTILIVSLLWYIKVDTLETLFQIKLILFSSNFTLLYYTKFLYLFFNTFILDSSLQTFQHIIGTQYYIFSLYQANSPFCPLQYIRGSFYSFVQLSSIILSIVGIIWINREGTAIDETLAQMILWIQQEKSLSSDRHYYIINKTKILSTTCQFIN